MRNIGLLLLLLLGSFAVTLNAQLLVYEGFDYPGSSASGNIADTLNTRSGGFGWASGWSSTNTDARTVSPGSTFAGVESLGNRARLRGTATRALGNPIAQTSGTVWLGTFVRCSNSARTATFALRQSGTNSMTITVKPEGVVNIAGANTGVVGTTGVFYFLVRIDFNATGNTVYGWVNPDLSAEPATATANVTVTTPTNWGIDEILLNHSSGSSHESNFDEIRLGRTFIDAISGTGQGTGGVPPIAVLTATPTEGLAPLSVFFDARASFDSDGNITAYDWNFGDGTSGTGATVAHTYTSAGTYAAILTVTDNLGVQSRDTLVITAQTGATLVNLALGKPVTVDSELNTTNVAEKAVDGNVGPADASTRWVSADNGYPHWIAVDLGDFYEISEVRFYMGASGVYKHPVYDFQIQRWNGTDWVDIVNITGNSDPTPFVTFAPVVTDRVRLYGTAGETGIMRIYELEVYGTLPSGNIKPTVVFTADPTFGAAPLSVNFDASGSNDPDGTIVSYEWNFGDGTTVTGVTTSHTFTANGVYNVSLTVTDDGGEFRQQSTQIFVGNRPPVVSFTANPTNGFAPLDVFFDATASTDPDNDMATTTYTWDFGDGTTGTGVTTSHVYAEGNFYAKLTITDVEGASATDSILINVSGGFVKGDLLPIADAFIRGGTFANNNYGAAPTIDLKSDAQANLTRQGFLKFDVSGFTGVEEAELRLYKIQSGAINIRFVTDDSWQEGSGNATETGDGITFATAPSFGTCSGCTRLTDEGDYYRFNLKQILTQEAAGDGILSLAFTGGGSNNTTLGSRENPTPAFRPVLRITASGAAFSPVSEFTTSNIVGAPPLQVSFDATPSVDPDGTIVSYEWNFGDGTTATGQQITHTFTQDGTFIVVLTVVDDDGRVGTSQAIITLFNTLPVADFAIANAVGEAPLDVSFDAGFNTVDSTGSYDPDPNGNIAFYIWNFGDGASDTLTIPTASHIYTASGVYTAQLTVVDNLGGTAIATERVLVRTPGSITLLPVADAMVDREFPDQNFNSNNRLELWNTGSRNVSNEAFIKFDLNALAGVDIQNAKLRLFAQRYGFVIGTKNTFSLVGDDNWDETTITWNTKPPSDGNQVAVWEPLRFNRRVVEFDIKDLVESELVKDGILTLHLYSPEVIGGFDYTSYYSREEGEGRSPEIIINGDAPIVYNDNVIFTGDFESATQAGSNAAFDFSGWQRDNTFNSHPFEGQITDQPTRNGRYSYKTVMNYKTENNTKNVRNEVAVFNFAAPGDARWLGYSIYVPEDYPIHEKFHIVAQGHDNPDPGEPSRSPYYSHEMRGDEWAIFVRSDKKLISTGGGTSSTTTEATWRGQLEVGRWTDFVVYYKHSFEDDGVLIIWKDDNPVPVLQHYGPNCYNDQTFKFYWKQGIYKPDYGLNDPPQIIIYHDEVRIGDENSTYADVAPSGVARPLPEQPLAAFTTNVTSGEAPLTVNFDATASLPATGRTIVRYEWSFGDDSTAVGQQVSHVYTTSGPKIVRLKVIDDIGTAGFAFDTILVTVPTGLEQVIAANADAFLRGGSFGGAINRETNYGRELRLEATDQGGPNNSGTKRFLVRWSLNNIGEVYSAKARFYINRVGPVIDLKNRIALVENYQWVEDSVTWNSFDAATKTTSTLFEILPLTYENGIVEVDLTSTILQQLAKGDTSLTLLVTSPVNLGGNGFTYYHSREAGLAPELILNSTPPQDVSNLLFAGDFEVAQLGTTPENFSKWNREFPPTEGALVEAPSRGGQYSYKATLKKSELDSRVRNEVSIFRYARLSDERWTGWSSFIPPDWKDHNLFTIIMQIHDQPDRSLGEGDRSPMAYLELRNGIMRFGVRTDPNALSLPAQDGSGGTIITRNLYEGPYVKGQWMDFVLYQKLSFGDDGVTKLWLNGELIVEDYGPNAYNDQGYFYYKTGIYKPGYNQNTTYVDANGVERSLEEVVIYTDQVRVGDALADYNTVAPSGTINSNVAPLAAFVVDPEVFTPGENVLFNGSESFAFGTGNSIVAYRWNFGDGSPEQVSSSPQISHVFDTIGAFTVTLTVTDNNGITGSTTQTVIGSNNIGAGNVLFAVGNAAQPNNAEVKIQQRLQILGYDVTLATASSTKSSDALAYDLVLISSTVGVNDVLAKFKDVAIPVLVWESGVYDDMALVSGSTGSEGGEDRIVIVNPGHPLAAGLTDTIMVTNTGATFTWANTLSNAINIATLDTEPDRKVIFGIEAGNPLVNGTAYERRVGFFLHDNTAADLNANGYALFDAAIAWLLGKPAGTPVARITATPAEGPAPLLVNLSGSASTDDGNITLYEWDFGDGTTGIGAQVNHTYQNPGNYNVVLRVTDNNFNIDYVNYYIKVTGTLITEVSAVTGEDYEVDILDVGTFYHFDRDYTIVTLPDSLPAGTEFIRTGNQLLKGSSNPEFLSFTLTAPAKVFVAYDPRASVIPEWLSSFALTGDTLLTSDPAVNLILYVKDFPAGRVTLGGTLATPAIGAQTGYFVAAIRNGDPPFQPLVQLKSKTAGVANDNQIQTYFELTNISDNPLPLDELTVRYWFTAEEYAAFNFWCDYAQIGNSAIQSTFAASNPIRVGGHYYLDVNFNSNIMLAPGAGTGEIQTRFAKSTWTNFNEANDHSYFASNVYVENQQITVYQNEQLIWGIEPDPETPRTALQVDYKPGDPWGPQDNQLMPNFNLFNTGNTNVALSDVKIRYWFTAEGESSVNYWTDWAAIGNGNVTGTVYPTATPRQGADRYLELTFNSNAGLLRGLSSTGVIQSRLAKANWSAFDERNDHSYIQTYSFVPDSNITVYLNDQLIWGVEPAAIANLQPSVPAALQSQDSAIPTSIFPNPTTGPFAVRFGLNESQQVRLSLFDLQGKRLEVYQANLDRGLHEVRFQPEQLQAGIYLLRIEYQGHMEVKKVVIRK